MGVICDCQICECDIEIIEEFDGVGAFVCFECSNGDHGEER